MSKVTWSTELLTLLQAPPTPDNYQFLNQWLLREHAHGDLTGNQYGNNPFFTTAGAGGTVGGLKAGTFPRVPASVSPGANKAGVAMYPSLEVGVFANAYHIGTQYPAIAAAIKSGHPGSYANNPEFQAELSRWSGSGYSGFSNIAAPTGPVGATVDTGLVTKFGQAVLKGSLTAGDWGVQPGSIAGNTASAVGGAVTGAVSSAEAVTKFLGRLTDPSYLLRGLQIVAGGALVAGGVFLLAKQVGLAQEVPGPVGAVASNLPVQ